MGEHCRRSLTLHGDKLVAGYLEKLQPTCWLRAFEPRRGSYHNTAGDFFLLDGVGGTESAQRRTRAWMTEQVELGSSSSG